MRRIFMALTAGVIAVPVAVVACSSVGVVTAGASLYASKGAFCGANDAIDRETANVESGTGFLKVMKSHTHQLDVMEKNLRSAIKTGNANTFFALAGSSAGASDTYCGVQGNGQPLPAYFKQGAKSSFCKTFLPVYGAVSDAQSDADTLAAVTAHQTQINQLGSEVSTLPKSIKAQATKAMQTAQAAIASESATPITSDNSNSAPDVALYCGVNE
jgi:hypothetical protein